MARYNINREPSVDETLEKEATESKETEKVEEKETKKPTKKAIPANGTAKVW